MNINRTTFLAYVRRAPFGGRLLQDQVDGMNVLLDAWEKYGNGDIRFAAYIFAGVFHETGTKMVPVREGFAKTDAAARKVVAKRPYGKVQNGFVWYGRGRIQNTWYDNYVKITKRYGIPASTNPDILLDSVTDAMVTVRGHMDGIWTGKKLSNYFNATKEAPKEARRIVNGTDKAGLIEDYYYNFLGAFKAAIQDVPPPDVSEKEAQPDKPNLATDPATIGVGIAGVGAAAGYAGDLVGKIDNPWALAGLAVVVIGVVIFFVGRFAIARKAGA